MGQYKQSDPFYHSSAWKTVRKKRLEIDHYKCVRCMERFLHGEMTRPRDADMVHHKIPRHERPDLELNLDNLESLCNQCHNAKHPEKGGQGRAGTASRTEAPVFPRVIKV